MGVYIIEDGCIERNARLPELIKSIYNSEIRTLEKASTGTDLEKFYDCIDEAELSAERLRSMGAEDKAKELEERCEYLRSKTLPEIRMEYYSEKDEQEYKEKDAHTLFEKVDDYFKHVSFC